MTNPREPMKSNNQNTTLAAEKIQEVFDGLLTKTSSKFITHEQFVEALAIATINTSNKIKKGLGIAILQTLVLDLQDFINFEIYNQDQKLPQNTNKQYQQESKTNNSTISINNLLAQDSIMSRMGYSVAEGTHTKIQRHSILKKIYVAQNFPDATEEETKRWGAPQSEQRLQAMAKFLYWLHSFQGIENRSAQQKWADDLSWLKENFYNDTMSFSWPIIDGKKTPFDTTANPSFMKPLRPSIEFSKIIGSTPLPRTEAISELWLYIKKNNLQDQKNPRFINCDENLFLIFKKPKVSMFEIAGLIGKHLKYL